MPNYRRNYVPGGTYFFTVVTHRRRPILTSSLARKCLREAIRTVREERPFELIAIILLPDHLHAVWTLPREDDDYSTRWSHLKAEFTRSYLSSGGTEADRSDSRVHQGERGIWQRRFWEHTCEDEADLKRLVDYIHWNPRKHNLVQRIKDYRWSSFHRFVRLGEYDEEWGGTDPCPDWDDPEWE
jgi:putative transposase